MPPTRPLATNCRYGLNCTRADCYYMHPKGRDMKQNCSFGRSCFRKVCHLNHPEGRMMDQLRPHLDYCAACTLVRPKELGRISAAFRAAFPAPNDGKERCDFVAAVPMRLAFHDWKAYRGRSVTGTPDGVPSTPEQIRLFPRTRRGEILLQNSNIGAGMRWSPTPYRPWRTLERMVTHDQHWEDNQDMYVLCACYEDTARGQGVCIELSVIGPVKPGDDGDAVKAAIRVAKDVLGLPGAAAQSWFVFNVSRPDEIEGESQVVTVKSILDPAKLPLVSRSSSESSASPKVSSTPAGLSGAQVYPYTSHRQQQVSAPPPATPPLTRHVSPPSIPSTGVSGGRTAKTGTAPYVPPPGLETPSSVGLAPSEESPWSGLPRPSPLNHRMGRVPVSTPSVPHQQQQQTIAPSSIGAEPKFGACVDEAPVALGTAKTLSAAELGMGGPGELAGVMPLASAVARPAPNPVPAAADELSELLAKLNMTKYRPKFDSKQVDFRTLKMMSQEEQLSGIGIPLGPRIKLMTELGIERSCT